MSLESLTKTLLKDIGNSQEQLQVSVDSYACMIPNGCDTMFFSMQWSPELF